MTKKHIPGKRIKTWHRAYKRGGGKASLRAYARELLGSMTAGEQDTARRWAGGKVAP